MPDSAARSQSRDATNSRIHAELQRTLGQIRNPVVLRRSNEIVLHATKGAVDRVANTFLGHREQTAEQVRQVAGLQRLPKEAIRTLESLEFLSRVGETKSITYTLTPAGSAYVHAGTDHKPGILQGTLLANSNFMSFWSTFGAGHAEFSKRDLREYIAANYRLSPSTSNLYAGYVVSFVRYSQLVVDSSISRLKYDIVGDFARDKAVATAADEDRARRLVARESGPSGGIRQTMYEETKHALFESATRLAELLHSEERLQSVANREAVLKQVDRALGDLRSSSLGAFSDLLSLARREALIGLRESDRDALSRSFLLMSALARFAAEIALLQTDGD